PMFTIMRKSGVFSLARMLGALAAALAPEFVASRAEAQWGFMGYGWLEPYTPPSVDLLNRQAIQRTANGSGGPSINNVYANQPNHCLKQFASPGFCERYDYEPRRLRQNRAARNPIPPPPPSSPPPPSTAVATAPAPTQPPATAVPTATAPVVPIASFFDAS